MFDSVSKIMKYLGRWHRIAHSWARIKNFCTVSIFSVFLADKYVVITTRKSSYVECFNFSQ